MNRYCMLAGLLLFSCWASGATDAIASFYVAPAGKDAWSGGLSEANADATDGPFATLERARDAARAVGTASPRTIVVAAGEYFLDRTLVLDAKDAGLTIEAAPNAAPVLYGGHLLDGWQPDGDRFWAAAAAGDFRALIVNGRFCPRARMPKEGTFEHLTAFDVRWMGTTGGGWQRKPTEAELTTMQYRPEDLEPWLDPKNAEITVYHSWDESLVGVASMDAATHTMTFACPTRHPPGAFGIKKYVVWNVREGMTEPGQWYLDRTAGKVVYWPLPGEDMTAAKVIAPSLEVIVQMAGTENAPIPNVTLRGLTLSATTTPLKAGGFGAGAFAGALTATYAYNARIDGLEILNVGGQGIKAWKCDASRIERCHVHHTGACGIRPSGRDAVATNNHVHDVGLTYPSAIALWGDGTGLEISHNDIHDTSYSAIACGGKDIRIESNRLARAMLVMHDGAGIYVSGGKGVILRGNFATDIADDGKNQAHAYYLDEQCENCLVERNLSLRCPSPHQSHWAQRNTLRNNVFVGDGDLYLLFARSEGHTFEKNVVQAQGKITVTNFACFDTFNGNVLFSAVGTVENRILDMYRTIGVEPIPPGPDNALADPMMTVSEDGVVRFAPESPALGLGIEPLDVSDAGPQGESAQRQTTH